MSSHSPHRSRRSQPSQGSRDMSPAPRDRRASKSQSMPLATFPNPSQVAIQQPQQQQQQQHSPTNSISSHHARRPSPPRLSLPTPPLSQDNQQPPSQPNPQLGYPRPIPRIPPPQFLQSFGNTDEKWQMTAELLEEIERADLQHSAGTSGVAYAGSFDSVSNTAVSDRSPLSRQPEKQSPGDISDRRQSAPATSTSSRDSPMKSTTISTTTDRRPPSPHSPNHRISPNASPSDQQQHYSQYKPPTSTAYQSSSKQTPPLQATLNRRTPERSLPYQEEAEDDVNILKNGQSAGKWSEVERISSPTPSSDLHPEGRPSIIRSGSNITNVPNSGGRSSRTGVHDDSETLVEPSTPHNDDDDEDDGDSGGYTPRSISANLEEHPGDLLLSVQGGTGRAPIRPKNRTGSTDQLGLHGIDPAFFGSSTNTSQGQTQTQGQRYAEPDPQRRYTQQQQQDAYLSDPNAAAAYYSSSQSVPSDLEALFNNPTSAYLQAYLNLSSDRDRDRDRPNAPIPPTPHSQTAAPSPSPLVSGDEAGDLKELPSILNRHAQAHAAAYHQHLQQHPPPLPVGSPYPYPYSHVRRSAAYSYHPNPSEPAHSPTSNNNPYDFDPNDPSLVQAELNRQWQMYALNNGHISDSTLSPSSTPFQHPPGYNPWLFLRSARALQGGPGGAGAGGKRYDRNMTSMSIRSSPSHEPVPLPPAPPLRAKGVKRREKSMNLRDQVQQQQMQRVEKRKMVGTGRQRQVLPPRVESTQPRETTPEPCSSGEETAGDEGLGVNGGVERDGVRDEEGEETEEGLALGLPMDVGFVLDDVGGEGDWIDEDDEGDEGEDLLELEYHPDFISNIDKRRRKWETRWEALVEAFQALDRQTDATLVLLASPSHSTKLHSISSRSIRRDPALMNSSVLSNIRTSFHQIARHRRVMRNRSRSALDRLRLYSGSSADGGGSDGSSSETREEELKKALDAALGSLSALSQIYKEREARWTNEMRRVGHDREHVDMLLQQALGSSLGGGAGVGAGASSGEGELGSGDSIVGRAL